MGKATFVGALLVLMMFAPVHSSSAVPNVAVKNLIAKDGTLISGFETTSDWTYGFIPGLGTGAQRRDTTHFVNGTASLRLDAMVGTTFTTKHINLDLSSATVFSLWVYVYDYDELQSITVSMSSSTPFTKFFQLEINQGSLVPGWNHLVLDPKVFTNINGESWSNPMVQFQLGVTSTGSGTRVSFDDLTYNLQAKAKCVITFDDGFDNCYSLAKPIMDGNNQKGVAFIISSVVGQEPHMTLSQMREMYSEGWDISDHSQDHLESLARLSASDLNTQVNGGYDWLVANGFGKSALFFAYPNGDGFDNTTVVNKVKENHIFARTTLEGTYQALLRPSVPDPQYALKGDEVFYHTSTASIEAEIDQAINQKGLLILIFHSVVDSGIDQNPYSYLKTDFQTISNYLASKSGDIDVVTFSNLVRTDPAIHYLNSWVYPDDYFLTAGRTVQTGKTLRIYSQLSDVETPSPSLAVTISYRPQGGSWTTTQASYNPTWDYWYVDWVIPSGATTGLYDVKIDVSDGQGGVASRTDLGKFSVA